MSDLVLEARDGPVVTLTLNRPEALNALSLALEAALRERFTALNADRGVRAVVLTGAGRAFCVGVDLKELGRDPEAINARIWHGPESLSGIMRASPHPIISAVNGFAVTGGLELALLGDFLIASEAAQVRGHACAGGDHAGLGSEPRCCPG